MAHSRSTRDLSFQPSDLSFQLRQSRIFLPEKKNELCKFNLIKKWARFHHCNIRVLSLALPMSRQKHLILSSRWRKQMNRQDIMGVTFAELLWFQHCSVLLRSSSSSVWLLHCKPGYRQKYLRLFWTQRRKAEVDKTSMLVAGSRESWLLLNFLRPTCCLW